MNYLLWLGYGRSVCLLVLLFLFVLFINIFIFGWLVLFLNEH